MDKKQEVLFDYQQRVSTTYGQNFDVIKWDYRSSPLGGKLKELEDIIDDTFRVKSKED